MDKDFDEILEGLSVDQTIDLVERAFDRIDSKAISKLFLNNLSAGGWSNTEIHELVKKACFELTSNEQRNLVNELIAQI